jgi:putative colanic acid biosynthesis UDP-glucose lipid carrier transferase
MIEKYMIRHLAKPGITGLAQVRGYRGETADREMMHQRVLADVFYIENWSFLLDIKIILLTVWNMFRGEKNAY